MAMRKKESFHCAVTCVMLRSRQEFAIFPSSNTEIVSGTLTPLAVADVILGLYVGNIHRHDFSVIACYLYKQTPQLLMRDG